VTRQASAGRALLLLCLLYALSYVDRSILSVLADPIERDLAISDTQMGVVIGMGFSIVYAFIGLPLARLLDTGRRILIVCVGVCVWSVGTMASAATTDFPSLTLCRAGVAIGEAALTPAAVSLIADLFEGRMVVKATAVYSAMATLMGVGAAAVGAFALGIAEHLAPTLGIAPWRITMFLVGIPGLPLAAVLLASIPEPRRRASAPAAESADGFIAHLRQHRGFYLPFYIGIGALSTYFMGLTSWLPTTLARGHGLSTKEAAYLVGLVGAPVSILAAVAWPWIALALQRRYAHDGIMRAYLGAVVLAGPAMLIAPMTPNLAAALAAFAVVIFSTLVIGSLPGLTIQTYCPYRFRARLMALVLFAGSVVGYLAGAALVPVLAKVWPSPSLGLAHGMALLALLVGPVMIACFELARRNAIVE